MKPNDECFKKRGSGATKGAPMATSVWGGTHASYLKIHLVLNDARHRVGRLANLFNDWVIFPCFRTERGWDVLQYLKYWAKYHPSCSCWTWSHLLPFVSFLYVFHAIFWMSLSLSRDKRGIPELKSAFEPWQSSLLWHYFMASNSSIMTLFELPFHFTWEEVRVSNSWVGTKTTVPISKHLTL